MIVDDKFLITREIFAELDQQSAKSLKVKQLIKGAHEEGTGKTGKGPDIPKILDMIGYNVGRFRALCPLNVTLNGRLDHFKQNTTNTLGNECGASGLSEVDAPSRRRAPRLAPPRGDFRERAKQCKLMAEIVIAAIAILEATVSEKDQ